MSFDIFQNIMTASDPAGGRAIKVTLQTGVDDAESYYTRSDSAGGRAIKVRLVDSGALILAGNVPLSTTPTNVANLAGGTSPLLLSTVNVGITGTSANAIFSASNIASSDKTFTFPNSTMTFAGINIAQSFTRAQTFNISAAASTPSINITSVPYTAGDTTSNYPVNLLGAGGAAIWSTSGTYFGINAVASFAGNFIDLHLNGGSSLLSVSSTGALTSTSSITAGGIISSTVASGNSAFSLSDGQIFQAAGFNFYQYSSRHFFDLNNRGVAFSNNVYIGANSAATGRLHVLGATSQNIVRFDDNTSTPRFIVPNSGAITIGSGTSINAISFFGPTTFNGETLLTSMGNAGYGSCFYFSGSSGSANFTTLGVNIGATTNTKGALLRLGAGTAAANTAPLKFTAGTNLTTPENGAFEFDGSFLYFTIGGVRLKVTLAP